MPVTTFIRSGTRSRLGWLTACLHAGWFFVAIANMSPPSLGFAKFLQDGAGSSATIFAGRPFHFVYESILLKSLILADLPAELAQLPFEFLFVPLCKHSHLSFIALSYWDAGILLVFASCQWLLLGAALESAIKSRPLGDSFSNMVTRHFPATIAVILLLTLVTVPLVNERSRRLGFRHAAISFR